ncbi:MAG: hypothetical protein H7A41_08060 [Chlamydiales bacterium]|nr:hypothetical protein [Chlamydiia bacterium]MCP5505089.1 hypothetical protein [Chlamydiales bacterium]
MKKLLTLLLIISSALFAHTIEPLPSQKLPDHPPPLKAVDEQLEQAQRDFDTARKMFNPWYAGPLLTPSANNVPPGQFVVQPYLFIKNTFAQFNGNRKSVNIKDIWTINPLCLFQMGWFSWLDFTITAQGFYNIQSNQDSFYWGDTSLSWGIQLLKEEPYRPAVRLSIGESFPTGRYEKLNPAKNGIDATGSGAYTTTISLNVSKVIWWVLDHPFAWRFSLNYSIPTTVQVNRYNAYGGGIGTNGRVRPGNGIAVDTSIELSFTQKWVLAIDLAYTYANHTTFSGHKGRTPAGGIASVGGPSNDNLSCAPALEYNPSDHLGFLAGVWFTITGRNSSDFIAGILTMYYAW